MSKIGVVVPVMKNFEGFANLIYSVQENGYEFQVYVHPNWVENEGVSKAWNAGLQNLFARGCTHVLVCNDDVVIGPHSIFWMIDGLANEDVVMTTAVDMKKQVKMTAEQLKYYSPKFYSADEEPDFSCFMVTPETIRKIGLFDENFTPAYFEDNDYHYRIKLAGKKAIRSHLAPMVHEGSVTQNYDRLEPVVPAQRFEMNRSYYVQKWGGRPGEERYKHPYNLPHYTHKYWTPDYESPEQITGIGLI